MTGEGAPRRRQLTVIGDVILALAFVNLIQVEIWVFGPETDLSPQQSMVASMIGTVVGGSLAFRSTFLMPAIAVNTIGLYLLVSTGYDSDFYQWTNLVLVYTVAEARGLRQALPALLAALGGVAYYFFALPIDNPVLLGLVVGLLWILVWLAGRVTSESRQRRMLRTEADLAVALAAANQERLELQAQRAEMARELHDLIGHTVNVMLVHAGAARRAVRTDPDGAEQALATIESTGRDAIDELDRVLGVLRSDLDAGPGGPEREAGHAAPTPDLSALSLLADRFGDAGLPTTIEVTGEPDGVPAGLALTIYRIVQEALTNTLKHAEASSANARVAIGDGHVEVTIDDDGRTSPTTDDRPHRGLTGIAERAALHGGSARYGPRPSGGFRVACQLPLSTEGAR